MEQSANNWEVKNQTQMRALNTVIIVSIMFIIASIVIAIVGHGDESSIAIFIGLISLATIIQFVFLKPAFVTISKKDSDLHIYVRRLFNPYKKIQLQIKLKDIIGYHVIKGRRLIGGKLLIEYNENENPKTVIIHLVNFKSANRVKLKKHLSETLK
ncbi:MAG TPA: hypothetical protein PKL31_02570 [Fulvivirga sp.]|nr:hypothetical protein [Fulvivirga sp.]